MKTTISFSIEQKIALEFLNTIENNKDDRNRIIEKMMYNYNSMNAHRDITCKKCKAIYSSKLKECPQCLRTEKDIQQKEMDKKHDEQYVEDKRKSIEKMKKNIRKKKENIRAWVNEKGQIKEEYKDLITLKQVDEIKDRIFDIQKDIDDMELSLREKEVLGEQHG